MLFERCARARRGRDGARSRGRSPRASGTAIARPQLDVHWLAALANPTGVAAPWLRVARGLLASAAERSTASRPRAAA